MNGDVTLETGAPSNPASDAKSNSSRISGTEKFKGSADANGAPGYGGPVQDIPNKSPQSASAPAQSRLTTGGNLMNFTQMLESLAAVSAGINYASADPLNASLDDGESIPETLGTGVESGDQELLETLNQIFTPILVMQGIEGNIADKINEACSEDNVLLERNMIKFDDTSRMAQLTSVCALLIARQKNTQQYKMYKEAAQIRNSMKLAIQKAEFEAAKSLATKFLVKVTTTSNSSVARNAAQNLLPQTQH